MNAKTLLLRLTKLSLACLICFAAFPSFSVTRHYYLAAEDISWDYAPSGRDLIHGGVIPQP